MTIEEAKQLIDGELYLFKHDDKIMKRLFRNIESTRNNFSGYTQFYLKLSTYEPTPINSGYVIEHIELIGVYKV